MSSAFHASLATIFGDVGFDVDTGKFRVANPGFNPGDLRYDADEGSLLRMEEGGRWAPLEAGAYDTPGVYHVYGRKECPYTRMAVAILEQATGKDGVITAFYPGKSGPEIREEALQNFPDLVNPAKAAAQATIPQVYEVFEGKPAFFLGGCDDVIARHGNLA